MSDTSFRASCGLLVGFSVLRAEGADAAAFLQSQLSADVGALAVGQAQWSAWLNPKGRVVALLLLLRSADQVFDLLLPDHAPEEFRAHLSRFILRRKASLRLEQAVVVAGIGAPAPAGALSFAGTPLRWLQPQSTSQGPELAPLDAEWRAQDLRAGVPRLGPSAGEHTAHMLGLDRLQAISLGKGCYPGQEIVARTHYLGQSKRGIACLRQPRGVAPERGARLSVGGDIVGEVLGCALESDGSILIQAVALALAPGTRCECQGAEAVVLALDPAPLPLG